MFCPGCGNQSDGREGFCASCGTDLRPYGRQQPVPAEPGQSQAPRAQMPGPASFEPPVRKGRGKLIAIGAVVTTLLLAVAGGLLFFLFMGKAPAFPDDYYLKQDEIPSGLRQGSFEALDAKEKQDAKEIGWASNNPGCLSRLNEIEKIEYLEGMLDSYCYQYFYDQSDPDDEIGYNIYKFKTSQEMDQYWSQVSAFYEAYDEKQSEDIREIYLLDRDNNVVIMVWRDAYYGLSDKAIVGITNTLAGRIDFEDKKMSNIR